MLSLLKFMISNMSLNKTCIFARSRSERKNCSHENPSQYKGLAEGELRVAETQQISTTLSQSTKEDAVRKITLLAGRTAEFLIQKFQCIATNVNKIKQVQ